MIVTIKTLQLFSDLVVNQRSTRNSGGYNADFVLVTLTWRCSKALDLDVPVLEPSLPDEGVSEKCQQQLSNIFMSHHLAEET